MITLSYEYKLIPTNEQAKTFDDWLEICRQVYNYALAERKDYVNSRKCRIDACSIYSEYIMAADAKRPNYFSQCKSLAAAKKLIPELKIPQSSVLQQTLRQLEKAFVNMFDRGFGFPRFKKHGQLRSFVFSQLNKDVIKDGKINLPKIGKVR